MAAFVIVNLLIGIVVNAMDQARSDHKQESAQASDPRLIEERMSKLQTMLEQYLKSEVDPQRKTEPVTS